MRRLLILTAFLGLSATLGLADTLTGALIDASCLQREKPTIASCQPSSSTSTFALVDRSGQVFKLDDQGNTKAAAAMKNRSDRSANPNATSKEQDVATAKVTGTLDGNTVKVETIEVQ